MKWNNILTIWRTRWEARERRAEQVWSSSWRVQPPQNGSGTLFLHHWSQSLFLISFLRMIPPDHIFSRLACEDQLMQTIAKLPEEGSYRPWGIQVWAQVDQINEISRWLTVSILHYSHSYEVKNINVMLKYQTKLQTLGHTSLSSSWFDIIYEISHWPTVNRGSMIHNNHSYHINIKLKLQTLGQV